MGVRTVRFGGRIGALLDPATRVRVTPNCFGEAQLHAADGTEDTAEAAAKQVLVNHFSIALERAATSSGSLLKALSSVPALIEATTAGANAELERQGAKVVIGSLSVNLSEDDRAALKNAKK